jgi:proteasome lid subunit RPN8/RPN11
MGFGVDHRVRVWVEIPNRAADPCRGFDADLPLLLAALGTTKRCGLGWRVLLHTHPSGGPEPSAVDRARAQFEGRPVWPGVDWVIVAEDGRVRRYRVDGRRFDGGPVLAFARVGA